MVGRLMIVARGAYLNLSWTLTSDAAQRLAGNGSQMHARTKPKPTLKGKAATAVYLAIGVFMLSFGSPIRSLSQESTKAWFGVKTPEQRAAGRTDDGKFYDDVDFAAPWLDLPAAEDPYSDIDGDRIFQYTKDMVEFAEQSRRAGDRYWGRIGGTASERAAADYVLAKFQEFNLKDLRMDELDGHAQWWPADWQLTLLGDPTYGTETQDYVFQSAFPAQFTVGAPAQGLEAELVYVGLASPLDLRGRNLTGKVAVIHSVLQPNTFFHSGRGRSEALVDAGAVGVITLMEAPGNYQYAIENAGSKRVPSFVMGGDDGAFLEDILEKAQAQSKLKVRMRLKVEDRDGWKTQNVIGMVEGTGDEYIVLTAHLDSYFRGANDNATGVATLIELAEHYSKSGAAKLNRNLVFVATGAHHDESIGVDHFIENYPDLLEKTVLILNIEHTASVLSFYRGPLRIGNFTVPGTLGTANTDGIRELMVSNLSPRIKSIFGEAIDRYQLVVGSSASQLPTGDAFAFFRKGHTVVQLIESNIWFHSTGDALNTIPPQGLERTARAYAYFLDHVDQSTRAELEEGAKRLSLRP